MKVSSFAEFFPRLQAFFQCQHQALSDDPKKTEGWRLHSGHMRISRKHEGGRHYNLTNQPINKRLQIFSQEKKGTSVAFGHLEDSQSIGCL